MAIRLQVLVTAALAGVLAVSTGVTAQASRYRVSVFAFEFVESARTSRPSAPRVRV